MDLKLPPFARFHPLRATAALRDQEAEVRLVPADFILPFFVVEGTNVNRPLPTLVGVSHLSVDQLVPAVGRAAAAGIDKVLLFGVVEPAAKDPEATQARHGDSLVARAVRALKAAYPGVIVMTDVCLCGYTDHGHCGILRGSTIDNDATLPLLAEMALAHAQAGADFVAPSAMMDGQVAALRTRLDEAGLEKTRILGYSAKYASKLYGPFRDAAQSAPAFGDRKTYQMDPRNRSQALEEVAADLDEGADWVMVKPASLYLDVVSSIKARFPTTHLTAYHTSGETMMLRHGAAAGLFDRREMLLETLSSIKRAGADSVICYEAVEVASWLS